MRDDKGEQRESDGAGDRLFGAATWVVVLFALLVVIGLVIFIAGLGLGEGEGLGF